MAGMGMWAEKGRRLAADSASPFGFLSAGDTEDVSDTYHSAMSHYVCREAKSRSA